MQLLQFGQYISFLFLNLFVINVCFSCVLSSKKRFPLPKKKKRKEKSKNIYLTRFSVSENWRLSPLQEYYWVGNSNTEGFSDIIFNTTACQYQYGLPTFLVNFRTSFNLLLSLSMFLLLSFFLAPPGVPSLRRNLNLPQYETHLSEML